MSFSSGHTTETFALAAAAGTVATMRRYRWAPLTWVAGGALALATGTLRIAADKHGLTDVVTGMTPGCGCWDHRAPGLSSARERDRAGDVGIAPSGRDTRADR